MKKLLIVIGFMAVLLIGCGKTDIVETYEKSESNGIVHTYYKMIDRTWMCDDITYPFRLELSGRRHNAKSDSYYVVLTDNEDLTFADVSRSLYGSLLAEKAIMVDSIIMEMK